MKMVKNTKLKIDWGTSNAMRQRVFTQYNNSDYTGSFKQYMRKKEALAEMYTQTENYVNFCGKELSGNGIVVRLVDTYLDGDVQYVVVESNNVRIGGYMACRARTSNHFVEV